MSHAARLMLHTRCTASALIPSVFCPGGTRGHDHHAFLYAMHVAEAKSEADAAGDLHSDSIAFVLFDVGIVLVFSTTAARVLCADLRADTAFFLPFLQGDSVLFQ